MPTLELISLKDVQSELSLTGKRGAVMRQYMEYIGPVGIRPGWQADSRRRGSHDRPSTPPRCSSPTPRQEPYLQSTGGRDLLLDSG